MSGYEAEEACRLRGEVLPHFSTEDDAQNMNDLLYQDYFAKQPPARIYSVYKVWKKNDMNGTNILPQY